MNRRGFLRALGLGTAGFALDPERLLWVPGKVATFDLGAWYCDPDPALVAAQALASPNQLLTIEWITQEALRVLAQELTFAQRVNQAYDDAFASAAVIRVR